MNEWFNIYDLHNFVYLIVALGFVWAIKFATDNVNKSKFAFNTDHAIEEDSNLAAAIRRGGIYMAMFIAMTGALAGPTRPFAVDFVAMIVDGVISFILLGIALVVSDKLLVGGVSNTEEVKKGNVAVALIDAGAAIATGLIARGSLMGEGPIESTFVFFILGQVALVVMFKIYEMITPFDDNKELKEGNKSAGALFFGMLVALGVILSTAVTGNFLDWFHDLNAFCADSTKGIVVLVVLSFVIDKIFLPNTDIRTEVERDKNVAATTLVAALKIGFAMVIAGAVV